MNADTRRCTQCTMQRCSGALLCAAHKCRMNCTNMRRDMSEYCTNHKCNACDASRVGGSEWCRSHKCLVDECHAEKIGGSEYCVAHKCVCCSGVRRQNTKFCNAHICSHNDCTSEREPGYGYCKIHHPQPLDVYPSAQIRVGNFEIKQLIGTGSFSQVRLASNLETGLQVAAKIVNSSTLRQMQCEDLLCSEISLLAGLQHTSIMRLQTAFRTAKHIILVVESLGGGELFELISANGVLPDDKAKKLFRDLCKGIAFLHSKCIAHRDIKPENLILSESGQLKIADLGFATVQYPEVGSVKEALGTPEYQAPEVNKQRQYNGFRADMWSCGVVLFTMVEGVLPFDGQDDEALLLCINKGVQVSTTVSEGPKELIIKLLSMDPRKRPTAAELLNCESWWSFEADRELAEEASSSLPPKLTISCLNDLTLVSSENEGMLLTTSHSKWSFSNLLEEAADFIGNFGLATPAAPNKPLPQKQLVRPQNRWRRGR